MGSMKNERLQIIFGVSIVIAILVFGFYSNQNTQNNAGQGSSVQYSEKSEKELRLKEELENKVRSGGVLTQRESILLSALRKPDFPDPMKPEEVLTKEEDAVLAESLRSPDPLTGNRNFRIIQSNGAPVKITSVGVYPMDAKEGNPQDFSITLDAELENIASVRVIVNRDGVIEEVPLTFTGKVAIQDDGKYALRGSELVVKDDSTLALERLMNKVYGTAKANRTGLRFEGSGIAGKVYEKLYDITFEVKDIFGNLVPIALASGNHCDIPLNGAWTMSSSCSPAGIDGVIDETVAVSGGATLSSGTLTLAYDFYAARTRAGDTKLSLTGGSIAVSGSTIHLEDTACGHLYVVDTDSDGYVPSPGTNYTSTAAGRADRCDMSSNLYDYDCDDTTGNVYPGANWTCSFGSWSSYTACLKDISFGDQCSWGGTPQCGETGNKCRYRARYKCSASGSGSCNALYYYEEEVISCSFPVC